MNRLVTTLALLTTALAAQQDQSALIERLREIANREVTTEAAAGKRNEDAAAWRKEAAAVDFGDRSILRTIAESVTADAGQRDRSAAQVVAFLEEHERMPVPGFEEVAGRMLMFDLVHRADAGEWDACKKVLPLLLRISTDHRSTYWLLGRRGRDAGTEAGRNFLQQVVIPELLADHTLDDVDRVNILRRLYKVEYTGPQPYVHIAGPGLDGVEVRTGDHKGRVLLVDYWATWCQPCLMALPGVVAAHRKFHDQGLEVVSISIDEADRRERLTAKVAELGITFPVIFDGKGWKSEIALANKVQAIPATFLIDRKGRVRWTGLEGEELHKRIAELLAER